MLDNRNAFNIFSLKIFTKNENTHMSQILKHMLPDGTG